MTLDAAATTDCVVSVAVEDVLTTLVGSIAEANREASVSVAQLFLREDLLTP